MRFNSYGLLIFCLACIPALSGAAVFEIADGAYFDLKAAINDAESNDEADTILLAPGGTYEPTGSLALGRITTSIRIYGRGATIDGNVSDGDRMLTVADRGRLVMTDLNVVNVSYQVDQPIHSGGVLDNQGNSVLRNVTIADNTVTSTSGDVLGGAIANLGDLKLINVTLSGNRIDGSGAGGALYNAGEAQIINSTIAHNAFVDPQSGQAALDTTSATSTTLENTIVAGNTNEDCIGSVTSSGGNLDGDGTCELDQASDQSATDPMLDPLANPGGGVLTHPLQGGSPARDGGVNSFCAPMDARGVPRPPSGNDAAGRRCDAGAHESWDDSFGFPDAATGSWFDPSQNGHGFMFEKLPDGRFLVTWFVFDPVGNRDWVQALGEVRGNIAKLTAYQVHDGTFPPGFDPETTTLRYWGTLSVVFTGCNAGAAAWEPDVPGYTAGGMPLSRITNVSGIACNP